AVACRGAGELRVLASQDRQLGLLEAGLTVAGLEVVHGGALGVQQRGLVIGGEKAAGEILQSAARHDAEAEDDETRQIAVFAAQAIASPGAETGTARVVKASVEEQDA